MSAKTFELKSLNSPEEVRKFDKGKVELVSGCSLLKKAVLLVSAA